MSNSRFAVVQELRQLIGLAGLGIHPASPDGHGRGGYGYGGALRAVNLAGVALGGVVFWPLLLLVAGVVMSLTPTVSQLHVSGRSHEAGEAVRQVLWIALGAGTVLILLLQSIAPLYYFIGVDPQAVPITLGYLSAISWGVLPVLGYFALRYLCEGCLGPPRYGDSGVGLLLKIPLNYWFIYGGWGLPAMGGVGCGWASAVVMVPVPGDLLCGEILAHAVAEVFAKLSWPRFAAIRLYISSVCP